MKTRIPWIGTLIGALLAAPIAIGAVACLLSGFELEVDGWLRLIGVVALAAVIGAVLARFRFSWIVLAAASVGGTALLVTRMALVGQITAVLDRVTRIYEEAYGWTATSFYADPFFVKYFDTVFVWLASLMALWFGYAVVRRANPLIVIGLSAMPVVPCLVATDTAPSGLWTFVWLAAALTLLLAVSGQRVRQVPRFGRTMLSGVAVVCALALVFTMLPPDDVYDLRFEWRDRVLHSLGLNSGSEDNDHTTVTNAPTEELQEASYPRGTQMVMKILASSETTIYLREQDYNMYDGRQWASDPNRYDNPRMGREADWYLSVKTPAAYARKFIPYYPASRAELKDGNLRNNLREDEYIWKVAELDEDWKQQVERQADTAMNPPDLVYDDEFAQVPLMLDYHIDPSLAVPKDGEEYPSVVYGGVKRYDPFENLAFDRYQEYLQVPVPIAIWAQSLVLPLYDESMTFTARADAIAAYVKEQAEYVPFSYKAPEEGDDYVRWFLEEEKEGCCVHFATATAMLLRAAGVPTRYVTGYARPVKRTNWTAILETDAHAWVEYYEPILDRWICLETTPASEENTVVTVPSVEESTVTTSTAAEDEEPTLTTAPHTQTPTVPVRDGRVAKVLQVVLLAAALVSALFAQRALRLWHHRRRRRRMAPNTYARRRFKDARRLCRMAKEELPEPITAIAEKAAFSQHTLTAAELDELDGYCTATAARIKASSSLRRLWLYLVYITE